MTQDLFICPDCELLLSTIPGELCPSCDQWRQSRLAELDEEYREQQNRRARLRMTPNERFGEMLADMTKAVERSRQ
jgi:hypothetical protein